MSENGNQRSLWAFLVGIASIIGALFAVLGPYPGFWERGSSARGVSTKLSPENGVSPARLDPPANPSPTQLGATREIRVFLHLAATDARSPEDVLELQRLIAGVNVPGLRVETPKVRMVPRSTTDIELRCSKKLDCDQARQLARAIGDETHLSISVRDFSNQFERDDRIRTGNYELWLPPE